MWLSLRTRFGIIYDTWCLYLTEKHEAMTLDWKNIFNMYARYIENLLVRIIFYPQNVFIMIQKSIFFVR